MVEILLAKRANPWAQNTAGSNAVDFAKNCGKVKQIFLDLGLVANKDCDGLGRNRIVCFCSSPLPTNRHARPYIMRAASCVPATSQRRARFRRQARKERVPATSQKRTCVPRHTHIYKNSFRRQARKERASATSQKRARCGDKVFTRTCYT